MWQLSGRFSFTVLLLILFRTDYCQDMPAVNPYIFDYTLICPAMAGRNNCYSVSLNDEHTWLGIKDAPNTQTLFADGRIAISPFGSNSFSGFGAILARDQNGPYGEITFSASYSFHLLLSEVRNSHLCFGLSGVFSQSRLNQSDLINYNNDPLITGENQNIWNPNASVSAGFYNSLIYTGVSVMNVIPERSFMSNTVETDLNRRNYFFIAGLDLEHRSGIFSFHPSLVFRMDDFKNKNAEVAVKTIYKKMIRVGLNFRYAIDDLPGNTISVIPSAGVYIQNFSIGYAYNYGSNSLQYESLGSHVLMMSWQLCKEKKGMVPCPVFK